MCLRMLSRICDEQVGVIDALVANVRVVPHIYFPSRYLIHYILYRIIREGICSVACRSFVQVSSRTYDDMNSIVAECMYFCGVCVAARVLRLCCSGYKV